MMSHRESLIFLVPGFPASESDTTCLPAVQNYVAAYARQHPGQDVHVVAFQYPFMRSRYRWKGVTVHALGGSNRRGVGRLRTWWRASRVVASVSSGSHVSILHCFWLTECTLIGRWMSCRLGARHIASIGGQDARADNPYLRFLPLQKMVITAGSEFAAETFRDATGRCVDAVIPLGLDVQELNQVATAGTRDIDVLGIGSLTKLKDFATFVDLCAELSKEYPALTAAIVGDGPERQHLERRIGAAGLQDRLRLVGRLSRPEAYRMMLRSRILLHPSRYESQGYVFLEAALACLHVVCRNVGFTGGDAATHRCTSDQEMLEAVNRLLHDGSPAGTRVVMSVDETVSAFESLYGRPVRRNACTS